MKEIVLYFVVGIVLTSIGLVASTSEDDEAGPIMIAAAICIIFWPLLVAVGIPYSLWKWNHKRKFDEKH